MISSYIPDISSIQFLQYQIISVLDMMIKVLEYLRLSEMGFLVLKFSFINTKWTTLYFPVGVMSI